MPSAVQQIANGLDATFLQKRFGFEGLLTHLAQYIILRFDTRFLLLENLRGAPRPVGKKQHQVVAQTAAHDIGHVHPVGLNTTL